MCSFTYPGGLWMAELSRSLTLGSVSASKFPHILKLYHKSSEMSKTQILMFSDSYRKLGFHKWIRYNCFIESLIKSGSNDITCMWIICVSDNKHIWNKTITNWLNFVIVRFVSLHMAVIYLFLGENKHVYNEATF